MVNFAESSGTHFFRNIASDKERGQILQREQNEHDQKRLKQVMIGSGIIITGCALFELFRRK